MKPLRIMLCILVIGCSANACLKKSKPDNPWDKKKYSRKSAQCTCGHNDKTSTQSTVRRNTRFFGNDKANDRELASSVFIHVENPEDTTLKTVCKGTIVTSNLIATSHKCLTIMSTKPQNFKLWQPKYKKVKPIDLAHIEVRPSRDMGSNPIKIEKVIFHPQHKETVQEKKFPEQDIALLLIKEGDPFIAEISTTTDTVCEQEHNCPKRPICVPTYDQAEELLYILATYVGTENERGFARRVNRKVLPGSDCDKFINKGIIAGVDTVCMKYDGHVPSEIEGGPLIIRDGHDNHHLVGLNSWVRGEGPFKPDELKVAYFTHVRFFVKYLEYQASLYGSEWCPVKDGTKSVKFAGPQLQTKEEAADEAHHLVKKPEVHQEDLGCVCGHSNVGQGSPRIMGGVEAIPNEFGWLVKLQIEVAGEVSGCGGAIINDRMILTAGHCFLDFNTGEVPPPVKVKAYIKAHKNYPYVDPEENRLEISDVIVNQKYIDGEMQTYPVTDYDIALLILSKPLSFPSLKDQKEDSVVPICLPQVNKPIDFVGLNATVAGWGINETNSEKIGKGEFGFNPVLHKLSKPILPLDECISRLESWVPMGENQICGSIGLETDSAQGDSGGPLIVPLKINGRSDDSDPNYHWVQVGLVSFGMDTPDANGKIIDGAGVYTNVQTFLPFIEHYASVYDAKWCKFETK